MVTDPNIILSGNRMAAPRLPDVNAMMQTRTAGMENIYDIEQQRAEQAKTAQKEQAAAQEAATLKALLPAYTYGIQTGDIAGAGNLVPPEMRPQIQQYIDALTGKSPEEVKSALIGSLSSSQAGQEALAAIQRAETTGIQREQNVLSRDRLNLDRQKQQLDAQGLGAWELKEGEGGFFWTNPRTREVVRANVTGAAPAPGPSPIPSPDAVTPRRPAPGAPETAPISTQQPPAEFRPKQSKVTEITQPERRAAALLDNVVRNADAVNTVITESPDAFQPSAAEAAAGFLPWGQPQVKAWEQNPQRKIVYNRMRQSIDALLTLATGAAYTEKQLDTQIAAYMPGFFDEDAVKRDKIAALRDRIESEKLNAGRAWTPEQELRAQEVFAQFETIVDAMSTGGESGGGGGGGGEADAELDALLNKYLPQQ